MKRLAARFPSSVFVGASVACLLLAASLPSSARAVPVSGSYTVDTTLTGPLTFNDADPASIAIALNRTLTLDPAAVTSYTRTTAGTIAIWVTSAGAGTVRNEGLWQHNGSGVAIIDRGALFLNTGASSVFEIQAGGGNFDFKQSINSIMAFEDGATFKHAVNKTTNFTSSSGDNAKGRFRMLSGGIADIRDGTVNYAIDALTDAGAVWNVSGNATVNFTRGVQSDAAAAWNISDGAVVKFSYTNSGVQQASGGFSGTVSDSGTFSINSLRLGGDMELNFSGNGASWSGSIILLGNTLTNRGTLKFTSSSTVDLNSSNSGELKNVGHFILDGSGTLRVRSSTSSTLGTTFRNTVDGLDAGILEFVGGTDMQLVDSNLNPSANNRTRLINEVGATILKIGAGQSQLSDNGATQFENSGTIEVRQDLLNLNADVVLIGGLAPSATLNAGHYIVSDSDGAGNNVSELRIRQANTVIGSFSSIGSGASVALSGVDSVFTPINTVTDVQGKFTVSDGRVFHVSGGTLTVHSGGVVGGNLGTINGNVVIDNGGTDAPGLSVGTGTFASEVWMPGGAFAFEIDDALGNAGSSPGWDLRVVSGALDISGLSSSNPFVINVDSLLPGGGTNPGLIDNFDPNSPYAWDFITFGSLVGTFDAAFFAIDADDFLNDVAGGTFDVIDTGNNALAIAFTPAASQQVPEPGSLALWMALCLSVFGLRRWRRTRR